MPSALEKLYYGAQCEDCDKYVYPPFPFADRCICSDRCAFCRTWECQSPDCAAAIEED